MFSTFVTKSIFWSAYINIVKKAFWEDNLVLISWAWIPSGGDLSS